VQTPVVFTQNTPDSGREKKATDAQKSRQWDGTSHVPVHVSLFHISPPLSSPNSGVFYTYFHNLAHRLRLEKLLYLELSRSSNGFFKVLLDPGGGFSSETAARRFQKRNGRYETASEVKR
jgi:hypothetical protein